MTVLKQTRFTDRLQKKVEPIWKHTHLHPFVQGIKEGTLPAERFSYYMKQDFVYLKDYAKLFALGSIKATDLEMMSKFAALLNDTLHTEMNLHREYCAELGISAEELDREKPSPVNLAYTHYMLKAGQHGSLAELIACLLPCMWSYREIGRKLKEEIGDLSSHPYQRWIEMYASEEFGELADWLIEELDCMAEGKSEKELEVLQEHFVTTSRFEFMFWDMVYYGHDWPV